MWLVLFGFFNSDTLSRVWSATHLCPFLWMSPPLACVFLTLVLSVVVHRCGGFCPTSVVRASLFCCCCWFCFCGSVFNPLDYVSLKGLSLATSECSPVCSAATDGSRMGAV